MMDTSYTLAVVHTAAVKTGCIDLFKFVFLFSLDKCPTVESLESKYFYFSTFEEPPYCPPQLATRENMGGLTGY